MYNLNGFGQNRPLCNNRQFGTMGIVKNQPEEMNLKPEYLGNEHFKFLNNFGLQHQITISDKKFVDINNCVNRNHSNSPVAANPSHILHSVSLSSTPPCIITQNISDNHSFQKGRSEKPNVIISSEKYSSSIHPNQTEDKNKIDGVTTTKQSKVDECSKGIPTNCEDSHSSCSSMKLPKKTKRNSKTQCDKSNQKSSPKKSKTQKNFQKQSKRESDRNIIGNSRSPRKRRNSKLWHKKSLEMEIMEVDDYSQNFESPSFCTISLPNVESICIQTEINTLSSPIKVNNEIREQNNKHSPPVYDFREEVQPDIYTGHSPKQNNFRPRLPSECESEDSFIVFEDTSSKSLDLDDDEESSDFDSSSDEDSDDSDFCPTMPSQENYRIQCCSSPSKKVRFAVGKSLCEVHPMVQWSFAYQKARKGPWEQFALDRMRFKNRVSNVEPVLNVILQPAHRSKVYKERFLQTKN